MALRRQHASKALSLGAFQSLLKLSGLDPKTGALKSHKARVLGKV